jgi:diguanylate cyclase (GGDEF)-like protein
MSDQTSHLTTLPVGEALAMLAPILDALAAASSAAPEEAARRLANALTRTLGWPAEVCRTDAASPPPGPSVSSVIVDGIAVVPVTPGSTLRFSAPQADPGALRSVAALCAQAVAASHSSTGDSVEANRRSREAAHRKDALVTAAATELRAAAEALLATTLAMPQELRVQEARRLVQVAEELERATSRPGSAEERTALRLRRAGPRPRVLVADDEPDAREALALLLAPDHEVIVAADGEAAVERARAEHPDVVLMDLLMPRMDGFQALERLRADPSTSDIPVIFVSGRGDDAVKVRSLDLGAVDFLQKPFSERELRARVDRTLRFVRTQTQLRELAQTDPLTGLANLRAFRARLDEEVKRARRYRTPLACVMADMDQLKPVNDELGHAAGDRAIAAVAALIREELRETDFGARYGGDEFVVLLPHTGAEEARIFAERVCARLKRAELEIAGRRVQIGASFGVACLLEDVQDGVPEELVHAADSALYQAKRAGRGRVLVALPAHREASPAAGSCSPKPEA